MFGYQIPHYWEFELVAVIVGTVIIYRVLREWFEFRLTTRWLRDMERRQQVFGRPDPYRLAGPASRPNYRREL